MRAARGIARFVSVFLEVYDTRQCAQYLFDMPHRRTFIALRSLIAGGSTSRGTPYRSIIIEGTWSASRI